MHQKANLLRQLEALVTRKQSKEYYSYRLGITVDEVEELLAELRNKPTEAENSHVDENRIVRENLDKGTLEIHQYYNHPPTPEEVIKDHKIDTDKWKLSSYWSKQRSRGYQVSAFFGLKKLDKDTAKEEFSSFLGKYKPAAPYIKKTAKSIDNTNSCLIINKQDAHLNKFSIDGDNDIDKRFRVIEDRIERMLKKASVTSNLSKVVYVVGSDEFNSEWTSMTTKGTPQENLMGYHQGFKEICDHEIAIINLILQYTDSLDLFYIAGNHDEFVGWHMVMWLQAYYRNQKNLKICTSPAYTKYVKFSNTAMCFNHGDGMKPERLAQNFPIEFKDNWSKCDYFYIFTGDKHSELSRDIGGIKFYRIPALSKSISKWDAKHGWTSTKAELNAFLIEEDAGVTSIFKETI